MRLIIEILLIIWALTNSGCYSVTKVNIGYAEKTGPVGTLSVEITK